MGWTASRGAVEGVERGSQQPKAEEDRMNDWPKLVSAVPVGGYRLRLTYSDGFEGEVDFADTVAEGGIFAFMQDPKRFATVQVAHNGMALLWIDDEGEDIDFCADAQRMHAEANAVKTMAAE
jgi:Protein of unknown function (DUF2442)